MYKIVILKDNGFEVLNFHNMANANRHYERLREDKTVIALFFYGMNDSLLTCTNVRV